MSVDEHKPRDTECLRNRTSDFIRTRLSFYDRYHGTKEFTSSIIWYDLVINKGCRNRMHRMSMNDCQMPCIPVYFPVDTVFSRCVGRNQSFLRDEDRVARFVKVTSCVRNEEAPIGPYTHITQISTDQSLNKEPFSYPFKVRITQSPHFLFKQYPFANSTMWAWACRYVPLLFVSAFSKSLFRHFLFRLIPAHPEICTV